MGVCGCIIPSPNCHCNSNISPSKYFWHTQGTDYTNWELTKDVVMPRTMTEEERQRIYNLGRPSIPCTNGWRPIETAPKDIDVLLWNGDGVHIGKYITQYGKFYARDMPLPKAYPTHWQPLPKPPPE